MTCHRTTARGVFLPTLLLLLGAAVGPAGASDPAPPGAAAAKRSAAAPIVFPVVGQVTYSDDFGDARGTGSHEGNDLVAAKRAPAVAAEAGTVKFWTTSRNAGCMLYLYGESGTTYLYIHLNNDLTTGNDNRGRCAPRVAYAPGLRSGARVEAGELVGFVGDSGDADGLHAHLHFEVHPKDGAAVSPFPYLKKATRLLFAAKPGTTFTLAVTGTLVSLEAGRVALKAKTVRSWPGNRLTRQDGREVQVDVPDTAAVDSGVAAAANVPAAGRQVTVWTSPATVTLAAQAGAAGTLAAARIVVR